VTLIRLEGLTRRFGDVVALDDLTLSLEPGIIGLVGANGAGKTTLLRILVGLLRPTAGRAVVLGHDVVADGGAVRRRVGYMPEHDCLPSDLSATDLIVHLGRLSGLPATAARERTAEVLRHVGLFEERYRPLGTFSTGMRQRVKLAQALVHDPDLVFLDEPTNGLDPAGREEMLELVERTGRRFGISVVVASHLLGEIERLADTLVVIDGGRLLRAAPLREVTGETEILRVDVDDGAARLAARLEAAGLRVRLDGRSVLVGTDGGDEVYDRVRDAVAELDLVLERLERGRRRLEELFDPVAAGDGDGGSAARVG
jgi:ABC-2 type transport system ATP-binding protein